MKECLRCGKEAKLTRGLGVLTFLCTACHFTWELWLEEDGTEQLKYGEDTDAYIDNEVPAGCLGVFNGVEQ